MCFKVIFIYISNILLLIRILMQEFNRELLHCDGTFILEKTDDERIIMYTEGHEKKS